jgi:hypothetical protein
MSASDVHGLQPLSDLDQPHSLLVDQTLDGWPQVRPVDEQGVTVLEVDVRFEASGAAAFEPDGAVVVRVNRAGRANAKGLRGVAAGPAVVTVTVPSAPSVAPLEYRVEVAAAGQGSADVRA